MRTVSIGVMGKKRGANPYRIIHRSTFVGAFGRLKTITMKQPQWTAIDRHHMSNVKPPSIAMAAPKPMAICKSKATLRAD